MANTKQARPETAGRPRTAKAGFAEVVLVCAKCAKRQGLKARAVRGRVKDALKREGGRKVRVVKTGCLGPCPKRHLAVATGASVAAGRIVLLEPEAGGGEMARALLPDFGLKATLAPP
ncbi:(2Fe-2S) ferredoxin domain-containing protein [Methylobacterium sp. sgz302541]|uniref:(2Fe-2S) ferredoxin domain-containing protein n=1 Tax=unclassified Methylobacterium TaxID=2615210 RepID=UPI003D327EA2